jgi:hypothetical protein
MMLKKLQKQELMAERGALQGLLTESRAINDVVGAIQFQQKLDEVEEALQRLEAVNPARASVALYFGGEKVIGSYGIQADFAGEILEDFQDLVSKSFARLEVGALGARGPVAARADSNLMVTNIARGSFGFILEEVGDQGEAFDTQMTEVVDQVASLVQVVTGPEDEAFNEAVADMDHRMVTATRNFFAHLSKAKATLRLVERDREIVLGRAEVELGRERTESLEVEELEGQLLSGLLLGLLPNHKRFEFVLEDGEPISGKVATEASRTIGDQLLGGHFNPAGKRWRAEFLIRDVRRQGREPRRHYTLMRLVEELI